MSAALRRSHHSVAGARMSQNKAGSHAKHKSTQRLLHTCGLGCKLASMKDSKTARVVSKVVFKPLGASASPCQGKLKEARMVLIGHLENWVGGLC